MVKKAKIIFEIIVLAILVLVFISLLVFLPKEEKENNINKDDYQDKGKIEDQITEIYYRVPFIFDSKAVLKAQYLNLSDYEPLNFIKCLRNINTCKNNDMKITAFIYKKADKDFCNKLGDKISISGKKYKINNPDTLKDLCIVFYKMKNKILEKKDCINPEVVPVCDYYFSLKKVDFIKSNFQLVKIIENPEEVSDCLSLEKTAAYYCLKIKNINCNNLEDPDKIKKCNKIMVNHEREYREFLSKVENIIKDRDWEKLKELILSTDDKKILHALARLGAINIEICEEFLKKDEKEYRYCLKRYYNQNFICELSTDKRQCYLFDVILNDKDCSLLRDPQQKTDCELFKKYIEKEDCNFFYTVAADKYLGYLCAVKTGRCDDKAYYDEMYKINCKYLNGQI